MHLSLFLLVSSASLCLANIGDYEELPGYGYYRYSNDRKTWDQAEATCETEGAKLVVLNSAAEATAVKNYFNRVKRSSDGWYAHAGFNDKGQEGVYKTVRGGTIQSAGYNVFKYTPTGSSQNQAQDCGGMIICGRLTELNCSDKMPYICELDGIDEGEVEPQ